MPITTDVLIVGAGPTGLLLAGDLAARGVSCTVVEQRAGTAGTTRAFGVHARTLEQLDARGLADQLVETGVTAERMQLFAGLRVDLSGLPSRFPYILITPQYNVEHLLERRALEAGARITRGMRFTGLTQDADGVEARLTPCEGDAAETVYRSAYLVGADGVHSTVRDAIGLPYPGTPVLESVMLADVRLTERLENVVEVNAVAEGFVFIAPFGDGWYRVIAWDRRRPKPETEPVDLDELRDLMRIVLGTDFGMGESRWSSRFHSDERQVPKYREGRVFLAGDAAHCHSPAGGLGMNTGIQDAANLGWKLAAALDGRGPEDLLDSYHDERHPAGALAIRISGRIVRMATLRSGLGRLARDRVGTLLLGIPPVRHKAAGMMTGIGLEYGNPRGAHRSVGTRAADLALTEENGTATRLYELLRSGRFVVIGSLPADAERIGPWKGRTEFAFAPGLNGSAPLRLVRPDGYVAWASDAPDPAVRHSGLVDALTVWCGGPE